MSKELEAFVRLEQNSKRYKGRKQDLDIVFAALKEHEAMKQTKIVVADTRVSDEVLEKLKNQRIIIGNLEPCEIKPLFDEETQNKLKAYKDIEEELGIDLITLFKALKNQKIYTSDLQFRQDGVFEWDMVMVDIPNKSIMYNDSIDDYKNNLNEWLKRPLCNYGKTWALSREELEENNE